MRPNAEEVAKTFSRFINGANKSEIDQACTIILSDHRTLQQDMFRFMVRLMEKFSEIRYYDLRNEESVLLAKDIMEYLETREGGSGLSRI